MKAQKQWWLTGVANLKCRLSAVRVFAARSGLHPTDPLRKQCGAIPPLGIE